MASKTEAKDARDARAHLRYVRISPRKVKIVLDLIRGKEVGRAVGILKSTPKIAAEYLYKLLNSAVANAENNHHMDSSKLYVSECFVCPGPIMKRAMPRAQGRTDRINKRVSHITIAVKEKA